MKKYSQEFPLLNQKITYLNTAASGLLSEDVFEFRQNHDLDLLVSASMLREKQNKILSETREAVGNLFSCAPNRIALTPNFSYGFNTLLEGLNECKKVLLLENDYPSINWAVESRNFEPCYAKIDENLEENIMAAVEKNKPDVFAFSLVQYINGIKIDSDFLKKLKENYPAMLLIADGTQYCGTEKFDFEASGIDILGASAYKWMNAGYGNAFFLFKEAMEEKVAPKALGFNSLQGKYKPQEGSFIGLFEPGHQDTLAFGSLLYAVRFIEKTGIDNIGTAIKNLSEKAKTAFSEENLLEKAVVNRKN
ncbi:MAG TPA: aminotransferase class V-fold PLP-dependent enzyme, partial [Salinimicrobium sp.]|nr:aminotransferase class V-fold PLP-dependent enzyme [Salinimicrobium sp.]